MLGVDLTMLGGNETYTGILGLGGTAGTMLKQGQGDLTLAGNSNVAQSMDAMSGELHASTKSALQSSAHTVISLPLKYLRTNLLISQGSEAVQVQVQVAGVGRCVAALSNGSVKPVWAELVGNWQSLSGNGNYAQTKQTTTGLLIGGDADIGNDRRWRRPQAERDGGQRLQLTRYRQPSADCGRRCVERYGQGQLQGQHDAGVR